MPKIGRLCSNKVILKLNIPKNEFKKKCGPKLIFFNEKNKTIWTFLTQKIDFECPNFMIFGATVPSQR